VNHKEVMNMEFWKGFNTYVGIQGVIALLLIIAYIASIFIPASLPEGFVEIMLIVIGFFFGKNGGAYIQKVTGSGSTS